MSINFKNNKIYMADKVIVELDSKYAEQLDLLKQIIPSSTGEQITDNGKMVEALIDSFIAFINEQAWWHEDNEEQSWWGCGGWSCGCSH